MKSLAAGRRFFLGTPVSSTNKTDCYDITEILLKVALNTITLTLIEIFMYFPVFNIHLTLPIVTLYSDDHT